MAERARAIIAYRRQAAKGLDIFLGLYLMVWHFNPLFGVFTHVTP